VGVVGPQSPKGARASEARVEVVGVVGPQSPKGARNSLADRHKAREGEGSMAKIKEFEINVTLKNNLLKERRLKLGLTQKELAQEAGISHGIYSELEGLRMSPIRMLPICRIPDCDNGAVFSKGPLCRKHAITEAVTGMAFPPKTGWKKCILPLADYFACLPSDLFPDVILAVTNPRSSLKIDEAQVSRIKHLLKESLTEPPCLLPAAEEMVMKMEEIQQLQGFIDRLKPLHQDVLKKHWGLGCEPMTLSQIGKPLRLSRERIRQIETEAIGILQKLYGKAILKEREMAG